MLIKLAFFTLFIDFSFLDQLFDFSNEVSVESLKYIPAFLLLVLHYLVSRRLSIALSISRDALPIAIYTLVLFISIFWSVSTSYSLRTLIPWIVVLLLANLLERSPQRFLFGLEKQVIFVAIAALIICGVNFLFGWLSGDGLVTDPSGSMRLAFVNELPAWYGHYIVLSGIILYFAWRYGSGPRYAYLSAFVLVVLVLMFMNIRAYLLGLLGAVFIYEVITQKRLTNKIFSISIALAIVVVLISNYAPLRTKMFKFGGEEGISQLGDIRISDRDAIANYLIGESYDHSGLLSGAGAGAARYFLLESKIFANTAYAHSDYVRVLTELGYLGLLLYILILRLLYKAAMRILKEGRRTSMPSLMVYGASSVATILFFAIAGTVYDVFTPANVLFLFAIMSFGRNRIESSLKC